MAHRRSRHVDPATPKKLITDYMQAAAAVGSTTSAAPTSSQDPAANSSAMQRIMITYTPDFCTERGSRSPDSWSSQELWSSVRIAFQPNPAVLSMSRSQSQSVIASIPRSR